jgi:hypothetical protein
MKLMPFAALLAAGVAPAFTSVTEMGKSPERWIWVSAALRSGTSKIPSTSSPERLRALYENCGIKSFIQNRMEMKVSKQKQKMPEWIARIPALSQRALMTNFWLDIIRAISYGWQQCKPYTNNPHETK